MASDFTVVFSVRQRFGNKIADSIGFGFNEFIEEDAPFVGTEKDYSFTCENIKVNESGILVFQAMSVSWKHEIRINDKIIYGGLTPGPVAVYVNRLDDEILPYPVVAVWHTYSLIIGSTVLRENNILKIRSIPRNDGAIDDFIIDNCYVQFKIN